MNLVSASCNVLEAEEARPVPVRAGDGPSHLREAAVGGALPGEAILDDDDPVQGAGENVRGLRKFDQMRSVGGALEYLPPRAPLQVAVASLAVSLQVN
jgi:hypothetical protein